MATRGKPASADRPTAKHDYTFEQSLSFWQRYWKEQIDRQAPKTRQETIDRARRLLHSTRHHSGLHDLAVCYGLPEDGGGDGLDN